MLDLFYIIPKPILGSLGMAIGTILFLWRWERPDNSWNTIVGAMIFVPCAIMTINHIL